MNHQHVAGATRKERMRRTSVDVRRSRCQTDTVFGCETSRGGDSERVASGMLRLEGLGGEVERFMDGGGEVSWCDRKGWRDVEGSGLAAANTNITTVQ